MGRLLAFVYGIASYAVFFLSFLYLVGFLANVLVPKSIDSGEVIAPVAALGINLGLVLLFGLQHSIMARPGFKAAWTRLVPRSVERSTYVLVSSLILILLYWLWQPMPQVVWQAEAEWLRTLLWCLYVTGLGIVLLSTFLIDHFDLFGLRQVWLNLVNREYRHPEFQVRFFYRFVRHPLYTGFLVTFWATPDMTLGHLVFAIAMTTYILVAVRYEERDLADLLGDDYEAYRDKVPMLLPSAKPEHEPVKPQRIPSGMR